MAQTGTGREVLLVLLCSTYQWPVPSAPRACHCQWPVQKFIVNIDKKKEEKKEIYSKFLVSCIWSICTNTMSHASKETTNIASLFPTRLNPGGDWVTWTRLKEYLLIWLVCFITYISLEERKSKSFSRSPNIIFLMHQLTILSMIS